MRAMLAVVVILQALVTGYCLTCEQCFAIHASTCSGIFTQCPPDVTHCFSGLENNTLGNDIILTAFKGCLNPSQKVACGRQFSFRSSEASLWMSRSCCDSDFCNGGDVQVPAADNTPNGYKCEDCFTDQSANGCTSTRRIQCTGKENTCSSFYGISSRPGERAKRYSSKGCATSDVCTIGVFSLAGTQALDYQIKCLPALKV